jgi:hypothetical protein
MAQDDDDEFLLQLIDHCSLQAAASERALGGVSKTAASAKQSTGTESRFSRRLEA